MTHFLTFLSLNAKISLGELEDAERIIQSLDNLYRGKRSVTTPREERGKENSSALSYTTAEKMSGEQYEDIVRWSSFYLF